MKQIKMIYGARLMSNKIKRRQEQREYREHGHPIWVKVVLIVIVLIFILGMVMMGF